MSRITLKSLAAAAFGVLALGAAAPAQAQNVSFSFGFGGHGAWPVYDHGYGHHYRPSYSRFYHDGFYARSAYRPVVRRFVEDDVEECRVIVKRRYNRFGELVVIRTRISD